ncbi:MAG: right-handed parallel beta-helix repeat-containing protein, partial [Nonomuraea sp.]|nr:right-handed parallel beta-helix repeat-containing protein [Nonomuraea sp.]
MIKTLVVAGLAATGLTAPAVSHTYHVDCGAPAGRLTTLAQVNALNLGPGDRVLFRRGTTCTGTLAPKGSGAPGRPIVVGTYGRGP